jgi:hypothetical protein
LELRHLIYLVLFCLSAGTFLSFGFVKQKHVGDRYYLYHGLITFAVALLAYGISGDTLGRDAGLWLFVYLIASLAFSLFIQKKKIARAAYFLGLIAATGTLLLDITLNTPFSLHTKLIINSLLSAGLMGFCMAAMLLGHWYLTQPKMPIEELKRVTLVFIVLVFIRFCIGTAVAVELLWGKSETELYRYLLSGGIGTFVLMRWAWGLLGPLALSYFIWNTVKIRSTQSATGILYVAVLFVMTGEILSQYLAFFHGVVL